MTPKIPNNTLKWTFLLTHPVWDVTFWIALLMRPKAFLLTHPVWDVTIIFNTIEFSSVFLLTHPVWDVTIMKLQKSKLQKISTHTSRVGCDSIRSGVPKSTIHFYSHIPCGMWRNEVRKWTFPNYFYSHIPCGMWRYVPYRTTRRKKISTHTSRVGCDISCLWFY